MSSEVDLARIEERAKAATPGSWDYFEGTDGTLDFGAVESIFGRICDVRRNADGLFIQHARSDVPALATEVRRLERERDEARGEVATRESQLADAKVLLEGYIGERDLWQQRCTEAEQRAERWKAGVEQAKQIGERLSEELAQAREERDRQRERADRLTQAVGKTRFWAATWWPRDVLDTGRGDFSSSLVRMRQLWDAALSEEEKDV